MRKKRKEKGSKEDEEKEERRKKRKKKYIQEEKQQKKFQLVYIFPHKIRFRRKWNNAYKIMRERVYDPRVLSLAKSFLICERNRKQIPKIQDRYI